MVANPASDPITLPPSLAGRAGKAWAVDLDAAAARLGVSRDQGGDVASWLVEAAWAHPFWHSYWVGLVHLRPVPGKPPPYIAVPNASHELWVYALTPEEPRQPMIEEGRFQYLTPINFGAQLVEPNDAAAMQRVERAVQEICDGLLSPDTDFRLAWVDRFGDNLLRKP